MRKSSNAFNQMITSDLCACENIQIYNEEICSKCHHHKNDVINETFLKKAFNSLVLNPIFSLSIQQAMNAS